MAESGDIEALREGLEGLRSGALYNLVGAILSIVSVLLMAAVAAAVLQSMVAGAGPHARPEHAATAIFVAAVPGFAMLLVAVVVLVLGWLRFKSGAESLTAYNPDYGIGATGAKLFLGGLGIIFVGGLVAIVGALASSTGLLIGGLLIVAIGLLLQLVGMILFFVMLLRMDAIDSGFKTAGILLLIGVILTLISVDGLPLIGYILELVGYYLVYSTAKRSLERLQEETAA